MTEIVNTEPLMWIEDKFENRYYKECDKEYLANARKNRDDITVGDIRKLDKNGNLIFYPGDEVLTDLFVARYGVADTVDRFIYFALPKYPKWVQDRFKVSIGNLGRKQKKDLSYNALKTTIDHWTP